MSLNDGQHQMLPARVTLEHIVTIRSRMPIHFFNSSRCPKKLSDPLEPFGNGDGAGTTGCHSTPEAVSSVSGLVVGCRPFSLQRESTIGGKPSTALDSRSCFHRRRFEAVQPPSFCAHRYALRLGRHLPHCFSRPSSNPVLLCLCGCAHRWYLRVV